MMCALTCYNRTMKSAVIGSGVIGLTSAVRLLEQNHDVTIFARDLPLQTTSSVAAAFWYPSVRSPRVTSWCLESLEVLRGLAQTSQGVSLVKLYELDEHEAAKRHLELAGEVEEVTSTFPKPWCYVYRVTVPKIDVPLYLPLLVKRFTELGGRLERREVTSFEELTSFDLIVNCAGLGNRELLDDHDIHPIRGQVIRIKKPPIGEDIIHVNSDTLPTYIVPRSEDCLLGGTYQAEDWDLEINKKIAEEILERTRNLLPAMGEVEVLEHKVGLRPGRSEVRLELELINGKPVIHNYGHGSIGHTLAWGCAKDVVEIVESL
jgi:D-amino-acid oxidase